MNLFVDAENGQSLVEFALCLPALLLIVTGIFAFGIAFNNYQMLTNATSVGAQQLAISRGQTTDPCATTVTAVTSAAPLLKSSSLKYSFVLNGVSYPTATTCPGAQTNLVAGTKAQLTVTYPCTLKVYGKDIIPSCNLTAKTAELVQ
jgi:Flp pilus assembly protein TadG